MSWGDVGAWVKENAGAGASLVGSLLVGNVSGAVAAGVSMISGATGTDDPERALAALKSDPTAMAKLKELYYKNEEAVRQHLENMTRLELEDQQARHSETQKTIRAGDVATDEYVRRTRPEMARQSWRATVAYCLGCWVYQAFHPSGVDIFNIYVAGFLSAPAWAYLGLRTGDKMAAAWEARGKSVTRPGRP